MSCRFFTTLVLGCWIFFVAPGQAQDWTTIGNDAQRSGWLRSDPRLSAESVSGADFQFLWKQNFGNEPRQLNATTPPTLLDFYVGYRGFRSLGFIGGSSNSVFAIDTDLARMEWTRKIGASSPKGDFSLACPGGLTAHPTRPTAAALPAIMGFRGFGRRTPAVSAVGKPYEGAATLGEPRSFFRMPEAPEGPTRRRPPARPALRGLSLVYALSGEGNLHTLYVSNGKDHVPPIKFLAPNANAHGLIVVDDVAYVATSGQCGGVPDGIWALDLDSRAVTSWKGPVAGSAGPALSPDGTLYISTTDGRIVSLEAKTLKVKVTYSAPGVSFATSPVVIDYKEKDYLAAAAQDGSLHLLAAADLSKSLHRAPGAGSASAGALATWEEASGVTWVLVPSGDAVVAWKLIDNNGSLALEQGWKLSGLVSPLPPLIVNGVIFAVSSGQFRSSDSSLSAAEVVKRSKPAKLYALDGSTGKVLWDSGEKIGSFATGNGLSSGGSRVYIATHDGSLYAFGIPMEH